MNRKNRMKTTLALAVVVLMAGVVFTTVGVDDVDAEVTTVSTSDALIEALEKGGDVKLSSDISLDEVIRVFDTP